MKVALLSDCYLPDWAESRSRPTTWRATSSPWDTRSRSSPRPPGPRGAARRDHGRRRHPGAPPCHPPAVGAARQPARAARTAPPTHWRRLRRRPRPDRGRLSFAWDSTRVTIGMGMPTAMTWHCMLGRAPGFGAVGFVKRWREGRRDVGRRRWRRGPRDPRRAVRVGLRAAQRDRRGPLASTSSSRAQNVPRSTPSSVQHTPLRLVTAMRLATRKRPRALVELVVRAERLAGRGSFQPDNPW